MMDNSHLAFKLPSHLIDLPNIVNIIPIDKGRHYQATTRSK